jgi:peptidoglycan/LPS O-acetylase OafA/YrhL
MARLSKRWRDRLLTLLPLALAVSALVGFSEWLQYHTAGASPIFGFVNPRCTRVAGSTCLAIGHTNLPWDAQIANWISWGLVGAGAACIALLVGYCVVSVLMVIVNVLRREIEAPACVIDWPIAGGCSVRLLGWAWR